MTSRSYFGQLISWIPLEIDPHDGEPNYFDFVTYFGLVSLSMGTIASLNPSAKDNSAHDGQGCATNCCRDSTEKVFARHCGKLSKCLGQIQ